MSTITIPKTITKGDELIIVPRKEYEEFSRWQKSVKQHKTFKPTPTQLKDLQRARREHQQGKYLSMKEFALTATQKKALQRAENNFSRGKTLSYDDLAKKLGLTHRS